MKTVVNVTCKQSMCLSGGREVSTGYSMSRRLHTLTGNDTVENNKKIVTVMSNLLIHCIVYLIYNALPGFFRRSSKSCVSTRFSWWGKTKIGSPLSANTKTMIITHFPAGAPIANGGPGTSGLPIGDYPGSLQNFLIPFDPHP